MNISELCLDSHITSKDDLEKEAMIWEGNYWDDSTHDYAELTLETVHIVVQKIAYVFKEQGYQTGERVLLLLPHVIQLPLSVLAAARIGLVSVIMDPRSCSVNQIVSVVSSSDSRLIVTLDGFWQGERLLETKKLLDEALEKCTSVRRVLVIRHTAPNPGMPPPEVDYPARRPCYRMEFPMTDGRDLEWSEVVRKADEKCDPLTVAPEATFAVLPKWNAGDLKLESVTVREAFDGIGSVSNLLKSSPVLSVLHPTTPFGLFALLAPFASGKSLVQFEGVLDYPDPSRLNHLIAKYEVSSLILPPCDLDAYYLSLVPVPSLKHVITTLDFEPFVSTLFNNASIITASFQ